MISSITLLHDWVMLDDEPVEQKTASGIVFNVSGSVGDKFRSSDWTEARVVAVGPKVKDLSSGERVLYNFTSGGYELTIDHKDYHVTKPRNIGVVLPPI